MRQSRRSSRLQTLASKHASVGAVKCRLCLGMLSPSCGRCAVSFALATLALVLGFGTACSGEGSRSRDDESSMSIPSTPESEGAELEATGGVDESGVLVLDDLVDDNAVFSSGGISGEWFTYSDQTSVLTPADHTGLPATDGEAHVVGQGFTEWGAGLSAYFRSADLSQFGSIDFRARGAGVVIVEVATPATSPPAEGGTCMGAGCFGHFSSSIELTDEYQDFVLDFAALVQPSWAQPAELSLAGVISVNFVAKVSGGSAAIDLWMDRLSLVQHPVVP